MRSSTKPISPNKNERRASVRSKSPRFCAATNVPAGEVSGRAITLKSGPGAAIVNASSPCTATSSGRRPARYEVIDAPPKLPPKPPKTAPSGPRTVIDVDVGICESGAGAPSPRPKPRPGRRSSSSRSSSFAIPPRSIRGTAASAITTSCSSTCESK